MDEDILNLGEKVSPIQVIIERLSGLKRHIDNVEKETERAHAVNVEKIDAMFERIDELKGQYVELVKLNEQLKTTIIEKTAAVERDLERRFYDLRDGQTSLKTKMGVIAAVCSAVVVGVVQLIFKLMGK